MEHDTQRVSRRGLVKGAAGGAAVGAVAFAAARTPAQFTTANIADTAAETKLAGPAAAAGAQTGAGDELVVHVRDARTGELDLYSGTRHIAVRDPELAARLAAHNR
jgi:hypothetical protein